MANPRAGTFLAGAVYPDAGFPSSSISDDGGLAVDVSTSASGVEFEGRTRTPRGRRAYACARAAAGYRARPRALASGPMPLAENARHPLPFG